MPKSRDPDGRDPGRPNRPDTPPEQSAVERAIRSIVERLKPKPARPEKPKPGGKARRLAACVP